MASNRTNSIRAAKWRTNEPSSGRPRDGLGQSGRSSYRGWNSISCVLWRDNGGGESPADPHLLYYYSVRPSGRKDSGRSPPRSKGEMDRAA